MENLQLVKDYIHYICENGIIPEYFFEICLLESEGNIELSTLYLEFANNRIDFDDDFFILKLGKILSFDIILVCKKKKQSTATAACQSEQNQRY